MRILLLTPEAYGGHGGIAQYNRDLLQALVAVPDVAEVVAVPRYAPLPLGEVPPGITYDVSGIGGKFRFIRTVIGALRGRFDLVICGHINLLPMAWMIAAKNRAPLALMVYGIDVWQPHKSALAQALLGKVTAIWSISEITRDRMAEWAPVTLDRFHILPNAIDVSRYGMAAKDSALIERYGLQGRKVFMLLGRLAAAERYKGVDELLELMPGLLASNPELTFMIAGDGDDRARLKAKAGALGVSERVIFTGYLPESEKADHLRLADAFVMPGRGEGFGFVFLEAMACGIPVIASSLDGSREAVRFGKLGHVVDPDDRAALAAAVLEAVNEEKKIPEGLDYFSFEHFRVRLQSLVTSITTK